MNDHILYRSTERQTVVHPWGVVSDILYGGREEKYLGFGPLVQLTRIRSFPGVSASPVRLQRNMELIDVIMQGHAGYQYSTGTNAAYPEGTVHILSAGKGIYRSEFNASDSVAMEKIQIGILPDRLNTESIHTRGVFDLDLHINSLVTIVSPHVDTSTLSVKQKAAVLMGAFEPNKQFVYDVSGSSTGLFLLVLRGTITVKNMVLGADDAIALMKPGPVPVSFTEHSTLMVIEIDIPPEENR